MVIKEAQLEFDKHLIQIMMEDLWEMVGRTKSNLIKTNQKITELCVDLNSGSDVSGVLKIIDNTINQRLIWIRESFEKLRKTLKTIPEDEYFDKYDEIMFKLGQEVGFIENEINAQEQRIRKELNKLEDVN